MSIQVRQALGSDLPAIQHTITAAFGNPEGAEIVGLVADIQADPSAQPSLSLVGIAEYCVVGHILFTSAHIKHAQPMMPAAILAPLSVHPEHQNRGVGGRLITEGLNRLKAAGVPLVFVLGHPGYYPKYGFRAAGTHGFQAPYPIPPENSAAWMVQELQSGIIGHIRGRVICADALDDPKYWRE